MPCGTVQLCRVYVQVTAMSRQVKMHVARSVDPAVQGITASSLPSASDHGGVTDEPTQRDDDDGDYQQQDQLGLVDAAAQTNCEATQQTATSAVETQTAPAVVQRRAKPAAKSVDRTLMISQALACSSSSSAKPPPPPAVSAVWTQHQQKQLESALSHVPKGAADRWDQIADLVADKTKVFTQ